ncbi:DHS-like NAD/FAD-binding domain-containing protein [Coemansia reversa NRRL 1564]|uniref:DHS-like NAD/FAD-binding domain-containing protein n=1 Tax=Coemansia reversa (strain ATCC 12441 / NRRL 1564) TaxID=763665 RepID=A0A2G5BJY5_COERN|nr:DHS-like NAD/FAD-binding domain-containing protein [Coemansia reversa NRRL 1564]|eukprot:PIA19320.1 DHS-like NAD/FAD-binding domain-containing protein [Coemansia reversa NRRL 1564]
MKRFIINEHGLGDEHPFREKALESLQEVQRAVQSCQRCIVITGAGISVSSGIPDFRSPDGLFQQLKQRYPSSVSNGRDLFDATLFHDPDMVGLFYNFMGELRNLVSQATHTPTHAFIKELDKHGKLLRCYTQNIDSLEKRIGLETAFQKPKSADLECESTTLSHVKEEKISETLVLSESAVATDGDDAACREPRQMASSESSTSDAKESTTTPTSQKYGAAAKAQVAPTNNRRRKRQATLDKSFTKAVQLHGDLDNVICTICHTRYPFTTQLAQEFCEGAPPPCPRCKEIETIRDIVGKRSVATGFLRPDIVLYNEAHPQGELIGELNEYDLKRRPDLLIVIGTSLKIPGIKRMIKEMSRCVHDCTLRSKRAGAGKTIFINRDEPPRGWEDVFDYYIAGDSDQAIDLLPIHAAEEKACAHSPASSTNSVMSINSICNPIPTKDMTVSRKRAVKIEKSLPLPLPVTVCSVDIKRKTVPAARQKSRKLTSMMRVVKSASAVTKPSVTSSVKRSRKPRQSPLVSPS